MHGRIKVPISDVLMEDLDLGAEAPPTSPKKYRVQLDFAAEDFRELNELTEKLGLPTRAELFRSALITLRWMYKKKLQGYTIAAVSPERKFLAEPDFAFLERVTPDRAAMAVAAEVAARFDAAFPERENQAATIETTACFGT